MTAQPFSTWQSIVTFLSICRWARTKIGFGLIWFGILLNNSAALDILGVSWNAEMQINLSSPRRYTQTSFLEYVWWRSYEANKLQSFLVRYIILKKKKKKFFVCKILKYMHKKEIKYLYWFCKKKHSKEDI